MAKNSTEGTTRIGFPDMRHKERKEQAVAFYKKNQIPEVLEKMLNKMYLERPDDLFGYMCEYFYSMANDPVISSVVAHEGLDGSGGKSVEVALYCIVCGVTKVAGSASFSQNPNLETSPAHVAKGGPKKQRVSIPLNQLSQRRKSIDPTSAQVSPTAGKRSNEYPNPLFSPTITRTSIDGPTGKKIDSLDTIRKHVNEALTGFRVSRLSQVDRALEDLWETAASNKLLLNPSSLLAVSCAAAIAASQLASHPLFLYLSSSHFYTGEHTDSFQRTPLSSTVDIILEAPSNPAETDTGEGSFLIPKLPQLSLGPRGRRGVFGPSPPPSQTSRKYTMPIPVVAVLGRGTGKLRMREFCLSSLPGIPLPQQIRILERIYAELGKHLSTKQGFSAGCTYPNAPYCPSMDRPEQALDWIQEAATNAGLKCDTDAGIFMDVGADTLYDEEKERYELVVGQWKTTDEVINMYSDLLQATSGLVGFIDPLHPKDLKGWKKLSDKLGSKCLLVADNALEKGLPLAEKKPESRKKMTLLATTSLKDSVDEVEEGTSGEAEGKLEGLSCAALTWFNTLSTTIDKADHLKNFSHYVMLKVHPVLTANTVMVDLAVASQCRFIRIGAPTGISTLLLNRMLQIREELVRRKIHEPMKAHLLMSKFEQ